MSATEEQDEIMSTQDDTPVESNNLMDDPQEREVLFTALDSFRQHRAVAHRNITHRRRQDLYALPTSQWQLLARPPFNVLDTLSDIDEAIDTNADLADGILSVGLQFFDLPIHRSQAMPSAQWHDTAKASDHTKAHSTLRQFYRDWTHQGFTTELLPILKLFLTSLQSHLPHPTQTSHQRLLLPGCGLGRLLLSLTLSGYDCTGNEISHHQLLASNYILNHTPSAHTHTIYPFVDTFTNNLTTSSQLRSYTIPDIHPATAIASALASRHVVGAMEMTSGDFITSYSSEAEKERFDGVVTHYFIDTAPNLFRYIETVANCLRSGGVWVNVGPLQWHFDGGTTGGRHEEDEVGEVDGHVRTDYDKGIGEPGSFTLPQDLVMELVKRAGFEVLKEEMLGEDLGGYMSDPDSMSVHRYRCVHWVARKLQ